MRLVSWLMSVVLIVWGVIGFAAGLKVSVFLFLLPGLVVLPPLADRLAYFKNISHIKRIGLAFAVMIFVAAIGATLSGHAKEKDRQQRLAAFMPLKPALMVEANKAVGSGDYNKAEELISTRLDLKDPDIQNLYEQVQTKKAAQVEERRLEKLVDDFKEKRDGLMAALRNTIKRGQFEPTLTTAEQYSEVADKEFLVLLGKVQDAKKKAAAEMVEANAKYMAELKGKSQTATFQNTDRDKEGINAYSFCKRAVEARLVSPKSADFPWLPENVIFNNREEQVSVVGYVDAQNGFGANIRQNYVCILKYAGGGFDGWKLLELSEF